MFCGLGEEERTKIRKKKRKKLYRGQNWLVGIKSVLRPVTIGGKKFWVFNSKFIPSFIFVHEVIAQPVCAYRIMSIRIGGI